MARASKITTGRRQGKQGIAGADCRALFVSQVFNYHQKRRSRSLQAGANRYLGPHNSGEKRAATRAPRRETPGDAVDFPGIGDSRCLDIIHSHGAAHEEDYLPEEDEEPDESDRFSPPTPWFPIRGRFEPERLGFARSHNDGAGRGEGFVLPFKGEKVDLPETIPARDVEVECASAG